jgi:hypothetical protein
MKGAEMLACNPILLVKPIVTPHPHVTSAVTTNILRKGTELLASNHRCDFVTVVTSPTRRGTVGTGESHPKSSTDFSNGVQESIE